MALYFLRRRKMNSGEPTLEVLADALMPLCIACVRRLDRGEGRSLLLLLDVPAGRFLVLQESLLIVSSCLVFKISRASRI